MNLTPSDLKAIDKFVLTILSVGVEQRPEAIEAAINTYRDTLRELCPDYTSERLEAACDGVRSKIQERLDEVARSGGTKEGNA